MFKHVTKDRKIAQQSTLQNTHECKREMVKITVRYVQKLHSSHVDDLHLHGFTILSKNFGDVRLFISVGSVLQRK